MNGAGANSIATLLPLNSAYNFVPSLANSLFINANPIPFFNTGE